MLVSNIDRRSRQNQNASRVDRVFLRRKMQRCPAGIVLAVDRLFGELRVI